MADAPVHGPIDLIDFTVGAMGVMLRSGLAIRREVREIEYSRRGGQRMDKINLAEKLARITEHWQPKVVGELNGQQVKLVKFQGEFVWHSHAQEDELFLVLSGHFRMELRDGGVDLGPGEFLIIPRGVEHRPVTDEEVAVLLFEPAGTLNTGNVRNERTVERIDWL